MLQNFQGISIANSIPDNINVTSFKEGDILISNIRPYLKKVWQADRNGGCSADVFVLKANNTICSDCFLHYLIANDTFINFVMSGAKGVKMPRGDKKQMVTYNMGIPHIKEQNKISRLLDLLNKRIVTQNKIIEQLQSLIRGIRACLFSFDNYNIKYLVELCSITTGKLDANAMVENGKYPFFTCAEETFRIDEYAFDTEALLISGNGANLGYIHYYNGKFNAYQRTYVLDKFSVEVMYLKYYLETFLNKRINQEVNVGNTPYIVLSTLTKMKIKIPDILIQQRIITTMKSLEEKLLNENLALRKYEEQKKFLLSNMFI